MLDHKIKDINQINEHLEPEISKLTKTISVKDFTEFSNDKQLYFKKFRKKFHFKFLMQKIQNLKKKFKEKYEVKGRILEND